MCLPQKDTEKEIRVSYVTIRPKAAGVAATG